MTQRSKIKVSVLIPTFNRMKYLPVAIKSILLQTHQNLELIVYDDGSTDNTKKYMKKLEEGDKRIRYVRCPVNKGVAAARNELLSLATGDVICWQDSDDISNVYRLEYQLKNIAKYDMVFSRPLRFNNKKAPRWKHKPLKGTNNKKALASLIVVNKDLLQYDLSRSIGGEDSNWFRRMVKSGKTKHICNFILYYVRDHGDRIGIWKRNEKRNPRWSKRMNEIITKAKVKAKKNA